MPGTGPCWEEISGSSGPKVRVWDTAASGQKLKVLRGHENRVYSVAISKDGTRVVSGSRDKTVRVLDTATGKISGTPEAIASKSTYTVSCSNSGGAATHLAGQQYTVCVRRERGYSIHSLGGEVEDDHSIPSLKGEEEGPSHPLSERREG